MCKHWTPLKEIYWQYKKEFFRRKQKNAIIESPRRTQAKNYRGAQKRRIHVNVQEFLQLAKNNKISSSHLTKISCILSNELRINTIFLSWNVSPWRERERAFYDGSFDDAYNSALAYGYKRFLTLVFFYEVGLVKRGRMGSQSKLYPSETSKKCNHKVLFIKEKSIYMYLRFSIFLYIYQRHIYTRTCSGTLDLYNALFLNYFFITHVEK